MTTIAAETMNRRLADDLDGAFPDLVRMLQDGIYSGALQLTRNAHDAQDVTQETFVRAYRALARYDTDRITTLKIRSWVWTIALNLCRNRARANARRPEVSGVDLDRPATGNDTDTAAIEEAAMGLWRDRLSRLSGPQRNAVVLHHIVGLPHAEIARITGRNENTIRSDVRRGLDGLRRILEEESP